jgi:DNA mismatch repair protein MSH3
VRRYYTPAVKERLALREQFRETRDASANKAFLSFLEDIAHNQYAILRDTVNKLATIDCLLSLALVAMRNNYVKPQFTAEQDVLEIFDGRHPMVEALRADPFVPNSVVLGDCEPRSKIITGPNMGGKSSAVRMIALITIMAQIGSYVPATAVRLSMLDGVLTRMGGKHLACTEVYLNAVLVGLGSLRRTCAWPFNIYGRDVGNERYTPSHYE